MLAASAVLVGRWLGALSPDPTRFVRPTFWHG